jgi:8-oxo-dGTP pyrophosphatase MutT (NUDIX family)
VQLAATLPLKLHYIRPKYFKKVPQNYKIYHNGTPVFLTTPQGAQALGFKADKVTHVALYIGKKKVLQQYLDLVDKNKNLRAVVLYHPDLDLLWADFQSCFKVLEAAGGYVLNAQNELLVFYRRGSWDMPKGKIDRGETPEQAAVREVQEETGLKNILLGDFLTHTYHTYELKDKRILKKTWWYRMQTTDTQLIPQTEEDIEEIHWVAPKAWLESGVEVYPNIREVIEQGMG